MQDEGIVQPVSKEMDQLSRRLHHHTPPRATGRRFLFLFFTVLKLMGRYRTVLSLDPRDAAYIAGLIDGEGTITLSREHRNENRRLVVSIASTERCQLEFVADRTGCGRITNKCTTSERHTLSYAFRVTNRQALELLRQVQPYLRSYKVTRAALALKHYLALTPRNGQYTSAQRRARQEFETFFLATTKNGNAANAESLTSWCYDGTMLSQKASSARLVPLGPHKRNDLFDSSRISTGVQRPQKDTDAIFPVN